MLKHITDLKSRKKYKDWTEKAQEMFNEQKLSIKEISKTAWMKEILRYWKTNQDLAQTRLMEAKTTSDLVEVQTMLKLSNHFINFIESMQV